jgi:hypothetical protein
MSKKQNKPTETKPEEMILPNQVSDPKLPYAYQCIVDELRTIKNMLAIIASPPK